MPSLAHTLYPLKLRYQVILKSTGSKVLGFTNCYGKTLSGPLNGAEQNYAHIEQEALAIVFAVHRFHQYVYGRIFTLVTDHRPLCKILSEKEGIPPLAAARMQHWALILSAY